MYQKIDFSQLQGIPVFQNSLAFLQDSYRNALGAIATYLGPLVIVSGVDDLGANYSDGWVAINGELLPFVGGLKTAQIIIDETVSAEIFADGSSKNVLILRQAKLGIVGGYNVVDFKRLDHPDVEKQARIAADTAELAARIAADAGESAARIAADAAESAARIAADNTLQNYVDSNDVVKHNIYAPPEDLNNLAQGTIQPVTGQVGQWTHAPTANTGDIFEIITIASPTTHGDIYQRAIMLEGSIPGAIYKRKRTGLFPGVWSAWTLINNP